MDVSSLVDTKNLILNGPTQIGSMWYHFQKEKLVALFFSLRQPTPFFRQNREQRGIKYVLKSYPMP